MDIYNEINTKELIQEIIKVSHNDFLRWIKDKKMLDFDSEKTLIFFRNLADMLLDYARISFTQNKKNSIQEIESNIIKTILLNPKSVNGYFWLAKLYEAKKEKKIYDKLYKVWQEHGKSTKITLDFISEYKNNPDWYKIPKTIQQEIKNKDMLYLRMSNDLDYLDIFEIPSNSDPQIVGRIKEARLICSPRDFDESLTSRQRTIVEDLIKKGKTFRLISHMDIYVFTSNDVFGPAIDTVFYNKNLNEILLKNEKIRNSISTIFEVGTGSGTLLALFIKLFKDKKVKIIGSDVIEAAKQMTEMNINLAIKRFHKKGSKNIPEFQFILNSDSLSQIPDNSIDLLYTNPPYIPNTIPLGKRNGYEGVEILKQLFRDGNRVLRENGFMIILYSSLTKNTLEETLKHSDLIFEDLGDPLLVPLDLREISTDYNWIPYLRETGGLIENLNNRRYVHWHMLHMAALYKKGNKFIKSNGKVFSE